MLICMRTTLNLDDALAAAAKREAARQGTTLTSLLEEGLRTVLAQRQSEIEGRTEAILELGRQIGAGLGSIPDPEDLLYDDRGLPA